MRAMRRKDVCTFVLGKREEERLGHQNVRTLANADRKEMSQDDKKHAHTDTRASTERERVRGKESEAERERERQARAAHQWSDKVTLHFDSSQFRRAREQPPDQ